ncbi:MAG: type 2a secretion system protein GspK [Idiomarinaceae bacterium HL-53]|nr:MAG: type 2a secretion system protein GspK [Idiomarinaceae bacterium HL-53]CUS47253.1 general secretion pathway protein K [Idiomarinaceae bacterium HL-53]
MRRGLTHQRGVAIISVLLVIAVVAVLAVKMSAQLRYQVARTQAAEAAEQGYWHWLSAEALARQVLLTELEENEGKAHLNQAWATSQGPYPVRGGMIGGEIKDLHACFNLNSLTLDPDNSAQRVTAQERFMALLEALEIDSYASERLTATLIDWLDDDTELYEGMGAEDPDYMSLPQPFQPANGMFAHISEFRQLLGVNAEIYEKLRPYVCVIPGLDTWQFNLNTVQSDHPELVVAFFRGVIDLAAAEEILSNRGDEGYETVDQVKQEPSLQAIISSGTELDDFEDMTFNSQYFELFAEIQYGDLELYGTSIIHVANGASFVLYRGRGGYVANE